jgi:hypothetical protein
MGADGVGVVHAGRVDVLVVAAGALLQPTPFDAFTVHHSYAFSTRTRHNVVELRRVDHIVHSMNSFCLNYK